VAETVGEELTCSGAQTHEQSVLDWGPSELPRLPMCTMKRFAVTFISSMGSGCAEDPNPVSAEAKYLKACFVATGYTTRDNLDWLYGLGSGFHLKMRRWWLNISVGMMADQSLHLASIYADVNQTPFWRRITFSPERDLVTAAAMVDEFLRQSPNVKRISWQDKLAFKTRDFTKGTNTRMNYEKPNQ
jgi:hypothetical protein